MVKLVLDDIGSTLTNTAAPTINNNNNKIEQALENTLSRDGSTPNNMQADLDMDSNDLLNVDNIHANTIVLGGEVIIPGEVAGAQIATQAEAEAGTNNSKIMTPLRTKQGAESYSLQKTGGTMTGPIIGDDGGTHRSSKWFFNDVRDSGADETGAVNSSAAFTAAKAISPTIRAKTGTYKLDAAYNLGTGVYEFGHNTFLTKPDNTPSDAGLGYLQVQGYLTPSYIKAQRSNGMVIAPNIKIKQEGTALSSGGDETIMQEMVMWYDRQVGAGSGYTGGASLYSGFINAGMSGTPAGGSIGIYQGRINVGDTENTSTGRHEHIVYSAGIIPDPAKTQSKWNGYVADFVIATPTTTQEAFSAGWTIGTKKLNGFQTLDADHDGSFGGTVECSPFMGGYAAPFATTYPQDVGLAVSGWSGPTTATTGTHASATAGWKWAFFAGGRNGVWNPFGTRSKLDHGMGITDYVFSGIEIFTAHPSAADPFAIRVAEDGGKSAFSINAASGVHRVHIGNTSGQFDQNLKLYPSTHVTSERCGIDIGGWIIGQDNAGSGTKDFFMFDSAAGAMRFIINTSGQLNLVAGGATLSIAGTQVLSSRKTGWAADTGTAKRTANATYSGTAEVAYTQATIQTLMNAVRDQSQALKALKDDLISHGAIGA